MGSDKPPPPPLPPSSPEKKSGCLRPKACRFCGQPHSHQEPHLYNYKEEVDEDLTCQICLQPFVEALDTPCGHTFCKACLLSYLKVNPMCPLDRKPLNEMVVQSSNLVLRRLLDKQLVLCPNSDSCSDELQRGSLDEHLKYRCSGTLLACQYAGAGCDFRGPKKSMAKHQTDCKHRKEGITRLPVLEGEVSHVEIPRTSSSLGITFVGGADTPLRCVVIQEVYPDGLIAADGRLQPGDQVIEINGVDMTGAHHAQFCTALRKMTSVLRLGVYRERIEKYGASGHRPIPPPPPSSASRSSSSCKHAENDSCATTSPTSSATSPPARKPTKPSSSKKDEDLLNVKFEREAGKHLGIRLSGGDTEPTAGIFIADIQEGSTTALDARLQKMDRILYINGRDVRNAKLSQASALIQNNDRISLVVARKRVEVANGDDGLTISHVRSKSAPSLHHNKSEANGHDSTGNANDDLAPNFDDEDSDVSAEEEEEEIVAARPQFVKSAADDSKSSSSSKRRPRAGAASDHVYDVPEGDDYMAIYETLDRKVEEAFKMKQQQPQQQQQQQQQLKSKSHSMEALETPTPSLKGEEDSDAAAAAAKQEHRYQRQTSGRRRHRSSKAKASSSKEKRRSFHEGGSCTTASQQAQPQVHPGKKNGDFKDGSMASFLRKALRMEGPQLHQRTITIKKTVRESLGMRIGGGIGSNEGDTPIYIANIHPHGCIGKSKQLKKGDLLLSVDDTSLSGLTHSQAVATLKATINNGHVVLGVMDGPETSFGASNFIPSWMYWQKLPRNLQYPKTVILHRRENASWGFSIVGGASETTNCSNSNGAAHPRPTEPIHVLFVVPESPAAKDARLKCGDRLLAVDGHSLENIPHHMAVKMLKQTSTRVVLEVVSWLGTEV